MSFTIESLFITAETRELTGFEAHRLEVLKKLVAEIRYYADCKGEEARDAREGGNEALADALFADRDALDRAADILQWG